MILARFVAILIAFNLLGHHVYAEISPNCDRDVGVLSKGTSILSYRENNGFCREWKVGPSNSSQRIVISFADVDIDCDSNDKVQVLNEERTYQLYDECQNRLDNKNQTSKKFIMARAKYLLVRLETSSNRTLSVSFDTMFVDTPVIRPIRLSFLSKLEKYIYSSTSTRRPSSTTSLVTKGLIYRMCSPYAQEITDSFGTLSTPTLKEGIIYTTNCTWIIRAPPNQRVYIVFEYINLPSSAFSKVDQFGCAANYVSIASYYRPMDEYRLCGQRRNVKLITTYNNVLINFMTHSLREITSGFSLSFRVISDPNGLPNFAPTTTSRVPEIVASANLGVVRNLNCGRPYNRPLETVGRIIGGQEANAHSWPWQIMITDGLIMCGAALLDEKWIVTAAHCTESISSGPIKAYLGMHNRFKTEPNKLIRYISQVIVHPAYLGRLTQWDNDIALMRLDEPVQFSEDVSPICLPPHGLNFATLGSRGYVTGWGDTQGTGPAYVLRQAYITVKKNRECGANSENMLCAGDRAPDLRDSCQGDSGGPFFMRSNSNYFLVGIVSWGYDCNGAGVYTKVSNYVNWIQSVINFY